MNPAIPYQEDTLRFGPEQRLIGTLTLPLEPPSTPRPGLVLMNAGALPRVGPHRLNVEMARTAAAQGACAIRLDLPGLGDSGFSSSQLPHDEQAFAAIQQAMDLLAASPCAPREFVIAGLCSGAELGFLLAQRDARITGLFMIEPYYYPNRLSGLLRTLRRFREYGLRRALRRIVQRLRGFRNHPGQADAPPPPAPASPPPDEGSLVAPSRQAFADGLSLLLQRGVRIRMIYANTLMGQYDLRHHHRHIFRQLGPSPNFDVELVEHTDHVFTRVEARRILIRRLAAWLELFGSDAPAAGAPAVAPRQRPEPEARPAAARRA